MKNRLALLALLVAAAAPLRARAHCDGLDGPVVKSAEAALRAGDPTPVLRWVRASDEKEIREAFRRAVEVRKAGGEARKLADTWFFETLVRVHRAGEGAPYTGLEPAGRDLGPAIPAADAAVASGDPRALVKLLADATHDGLHPLWVKVAEARKHADESIEAGRRYVAAYVEYVHYVERVFDATRAAGHHAPAAGGEPHADAHAH